MNRNIAAVGGLALSAILVVAGCRSDARDAEVAATNARIAAEASGAATVPAAPANNPNAAQIGTNLAAFDLVFGSGDGYVGSFVRTAPNTWVGPDLENYQPVTWNANTTDERIVLTAANPTQQVLDINVANGQVTSSWVDNSLNYRMAGQVYQ